MSSPHTARFLSAQNHLGSNGVDAILVSNLSTVWYLAGFTGSDGILVQGLGTGWFLTDGRYTAQASQEVAGYAVVEYKSKLEAVCSLILEQGFTRIGFEAESLTFAQYRTLADSLPGVELVPVSTEFQNIRARKDASEIELLARVASLASATLLETLRLLKPGVQEREIALDLEYAMRNAGADDKSFDTIVASGPRGALPHGKASERQIQSGDLVTIDFGAVLNGYHSDETVTVAVGTPDEKQKKVYAVVKDAHDRALAAVRPGVSLKELDRIARSYIEEQGFGEYFGHGLGHGVGLDVHESPTVSWRGDTVAEEGMVFTIEPGIYIPGWGGVRIEDTVAVTADGFRFLTQVPKGLMTIE